MKEYFEKVARTYIHRAGLDKLLNNIAKSDFYTAPASRQNHENYEGGLVEHSLKVFAHALQEPRFNDISTESLAITSLFHDLCKIYYYKTDTRNTKDERGKWIQVPYYTIDDKFPIGHGEKSVFLIMNDMELTFDEMMAIRWHMGGYEAKEMYNSMSKAYSQCPLAVLTHVADLKATYIPIEFKNLLNN